MATPKRTGGRESDVVGGDTAAGRRATKQALGPQTSDDDRDSAYKQGRAASKRAREEAPRGRRARGPAQVHSDPELQEYYEQGHADHTREARRESVSKRVAPAVSSFTGSAKSAGGNGAGFILGLIGYALVRNFLTGGWAGERAWFAAKFLNKVELPAGRATPTRPGRPSPGKRAAPNAPAQPLPGQSAGGIFGDLPGNIINNLPDLPDLPGGILKSVPGLGL